MHYNEKSNNVKVFKGNQKVFKWNQKYWYVICIQKYLCTTKSIQTYSSIKKLSNVIECNKKVFRSNGIKSIPMQSKVFQCNQNHLNVIKYKQVISNN